jgi:hypothetical protein
MKPGRRKTENVRWPESSRFVDEYSSSRIQPSRLGHLRQGGQNTLCCIRCGRKFYWQPTAATERATSDGGAGCAIVTSCCGNAEGRRPRAQILATQENIDPVIIRSRESVRNIFRGVSLGVRKSNSLYIFKEETKGAKRARNQVFIEYIQSLFCRLQLFALFASPITTKSVSSVHSRAAAYGGECTRPLDIPGWLPPSWSKR